MTIDEFKEWYLRAVKPSITPALEIIKHEIAREVLIGEITEVRPPLIGKFFYDLDKKEVVLKTYDFLGVIEDLSKNTTD